MPCPLEACEAFEKIAMIAESERGGHKGFGPGHVLTLLYFLAREGRIGRPRITRLLNIGESSAKTLLRALEESGFITRYPRGHALTEEGSRILSVIANVLTINILKLNLFLNSKGFLECIISCREGPRDLVSAISLRDYLVMEGCRTVVIGRMEQGRIELPGVPESIVELVNSRSQHVSHVNRGVYIGAPLECRNAVLSACIRMILDECKIARRE